MDGAPQPPAPPARERAGTDLVVRAVLREVHQRTMNMDLPEDVLAFLFTQLADIECVQIRRLSRLCVRHCLFWGFAGTE